MITPYRIIESIETNIQGEFMSISNIQHSTTQIHYSFHHFSKLVRLPAILRRSNIKKTRGIQVPLFLEWLLTATFSRFSIFRANQSADFLKKQSVTALMMLKLIGND